MGLKEDAMWKMVEKMGMPKSAIEAIKAKQKNGDKSAMPDMGKMMSMMQAMKGDKKDEMRKMAEKMGMPPQAAGMDGNEILGRLNRLSKVQTIKDVGLGYVTLGQPATTLSGGEAQRMKLASELHKRSTGKSFYILDEPTTGLHTDDIARLLKVLQRFADDGNTVLVIEHNLDVIKTADHIIDLGPEGGVGGGTIVATGTPEEVAAVSKSYTGQYLKEKLT